MAAISVQEDGGGDYTSWEAAVENASTADGDVITISETWNATTGAEDTQITVADALTMQATGSSKHIGRPWSSGETTFRHRNSSSGHSITITDTGSVTFIGLDIQNESTGTSDEVFRNNVANTFLAQNCLLGFDSRNSEQDIFYTEAANDTTFEQCHFYNVLRGVVDMTGSASGTINMNSNTAYDIGFSDSQTSRSGLIGKNTSGTVTVNMYNNIVHMNSASYPVCTNSTTANTTANIERLITNSTVAPMANVPATANYADNVEDAVINDTDSSGNYILLDTTTSPYDLRLFDNATNNAAQDVHATATAANLTIPSTDIVGTSRPQNTNFDLGAFEIDAGGGTTLSPTGIASLEAFGTAVISTGGVTVSPTSISSLEAFGTATITVGGVTLSPSSINSLEAFGTATITTGIVQLQPSAIPSAEAFGTPVITVGAVILQPNGIVSGEAFGVAVITGGTPPAILDGLTRELTFDLTVSLTRDATGA
ncbi:MAG: hypothetical protein COB84_01870 [Rhodobacteraceae bacterium]|nr:MAG: hypothetical protein COB84_01870 [Paracoccaceae bacterium]